MRAWLTVVTRLTAAAMWLCSGGSACGAVAVPDAPRLSENTLRQLLTDARTCSTDVTAAHQPSRLPDVQGLSQRVVISRRR